MSAETQLYAILSADAPLGALVGARIYPDLLPEESVVPYIGYERVATEPIVTVHGGLAGQDVRITIACWAATRIQAEQLADTVVAAMQAAGHIYDARGAEVDETTGRLAATLDYMILDA